ncbi:hypothetical protein, partial [Acetobacter lambici]
RLPCLEPARRSTMAHHVNRTAQVGSWVIAINGWYQSGKKDGHAIFFAQVLKKDACRSSY